MRRSRVGPIVPTRNARPSINGLALALLLGMVALFPSRAVAGFTDGEWAQIAIPPVPPPMVPGRVSFAFVLDTTRDRILAFGGDPGPMQDTWFMPLAPGSVWQPLVVSGAKPSSRYGHSAIYDPVGDRMVVFGGYGPGGLQNDVWALELSGTPHWALIVAAGTPPTRRQDAAAVYDVALNRMVLYGGYTGVFTNEVWSLSLDATPTWALISSANPGPTGRGTMQSVLDVTNNRLVVFGGWNGTFLGDTWALDLAPGGGWTPITTAHSPAPRREGVAVYDPSGDRMVVFGGWDGTRYEDCWQLSLAGTPDWTPLASTGTPPSARSGGRALYDPLRDRMVVFAGYDDNYRADTRALSLDGSAIWSLIQDDPPIPPGLTPRRDVSAVYDPATRAMLIFGGTNTNIDFDETWKLDLSAIDPQWQRVEEGSITPNPRHGHRAVWDAARNRMLVVGGYAGDYVNDVWELVIGTTPEWHLVSTDGVPPAGRMLFGLALDPVRDRLIMFGGHSGFPPGYSPTYWNDVWELPLSGPSALTWSPLTVSGTPPSERWIYSMRYDPPRDRMVMFGGVSSAGRTNEVWTLELSGMPHWVYMNPALPPPSNRSDHVMVYDEYNDRMVMFGGFDGGFRNDAWALELDGPPQWNLLSPIGGPPSPRDIIDGIYDPVGGRMIVFGGWNDTGVLADTWQLAWGSPPTPTEASLIESHVGTDRVTLAWYVRDAIAVRAAVERRVGSAWNTIGAPAIEGSDVMRFEDTDVTAGTRYAYRLRLSNNGEETLTAETEVEVPSGYALALSGAHPNPTQGGPLNVSFALARASDGRLELMDLAGRRVASRDLRGLSPGQHRLVFSEAARVEPGVYLLRLVTKERTLTSKVLLTR